MSDKREFLMLSHPLNPTKHKIGGWLASEKMDGIRCFYDGGITRGLLKSEVPFANHSKDERFVDPPRCTGLWSRYGNVIHAPDFFLDQLPAIPLDGELFAGRGSWQTLSTIVKRLVPDVDAWRSVSYNVFDIPPYQSLFATGTINNPNFSKRFEITELMPWARPRFKTEPNFRDFETTYNQLMIHFGCKLYQDSCPNLKVVPQVKLDQQGNYEEYIQEVLSFGGEGLIIRNPRSYWEPKRSHQQVKVKPEHDDEATVVSYVWGRETDKGSKLLGLMGALVCDYKGQRFELSGFTDSERVMQLHSGYSQLNSKEGFFSPGQEISTAWINPHFPIGSQVSFKYRELSDNGIPKEGKYWRKREGHS